MTNPLIHDTTIMVRRLAIVIGPVLAVLAYLLAPQLPAEPTPGAIGLSDAGRATVAVGVLMAIWWLTEAIPLSATALIPIALLPLLGAMPLGEVTARYGHPLIFLFLGGFLLGIAMERWGLHKRIALVTILLVGTRPVMLIAGFMVATAMLSMFVSNTATTIMLLPIGMSVIALVRSSVARDLAQAGKSASDQDHAVRGFATALMLGIAYAASIGGIGTLIGTPPNTVLASFLSDEFGVTIGFAQWMRLGLPIVIVFLPLAWLYLTRIAHPIRLKVIPGGRELIRTELRNLGPIKRGEWTVLTVFTLTAMSWILRPQLVALGTNLGLTPLTHLSDTGIAIIAAVALFIIPVDAKRGVRVIDWEHARKLPWGVLILFGGGLALAKAISTTGVDTFLGAGFASMQGVPLWVIILVVAGVVIFLTELTSNTAVTAALLPVLASAAGALDQPIVMLLVPATLAASCAFMLPVATPPNAIVFSSGVVTIRQMARAGLWLNLAGIVVVTLMMLGPGRWLIPRELHDLRAQETQEASPGP